MAIVTALLVTTLGAVLVSGAFLQQSVLVREVDNAAAARQARWLFTGAVDWVRAILREDARRGPVDHLGEPWTVPLESTRLDAGPDAAAWLTGRIEDAERRFNLRNLANAAGLVAPEVACLARLLAFTGGDAAAAPRLARSIDAALNQSRVGGVPLLPASLDELVLPEAADRLALARLRPFVTLLPVPTPVNVNTAPAEVIAARFETLSLSDARRLVESRDRVPFRDEGDLLRRTAGLPPVGRLAPVAVGSSFFFVTGSIEYRQARLRSTVLLKRLGRAVDVLWVREAPAAPPAPGAA